MKFASLMWNLCCFFAAQLGQTSDKHTQSWSPNWNEVISTLLLMLVKQEEACSLMHKVENCSNVFIAFLWMAGHSSVTEIQNLSRDESVNLTLSAWSDCSSQSCSSSLEVKFSGWADGSEKGSSPSHTLVLKGGKIVFNLIPQFFMVVSYRTRDFLVSFFTFKPQQHWKHLKISFHNKIFQRFSFILNPRNLSLLVKTVSPGPCSSVHVMKNVC
jgi:hypothetical protein